MDRMDMFNMWLSHSLGLAFLMAVIVLGVGITAWSGVTLLRTRQRHA